MTKTPDLNAMKKAAERKEQIQPYFEFLNDKQKKDDYDWGKLQEQAFQIVLDTAKRKAEEAKPKEKTYTKEELEREVKERMGDVDAIVQSKLDDILKVFKAGQQATPQEIIQQVVPHDGDKENPTIAKLEKMFEERGVGKEILTFKTIADKNSSRKSLTLKVKATFSKDGHVFQMLATPSAQSPFRIHQPENIAIWQPKIDPIFFIAKGNDETGKIVVGPNNPCLQKYLLAHPKYGKLFMIEDKKAEAKAKREKIKEMNSLKDRIEDTYETEEMRIMSVGVMGLEMAYSGTFDELYAGLYNLLEIDKEMYKRLTEDPYNKYRYAYIKFQKSGLIKSNGVRMSIGIEQFYDGKKTTESPVDSFIRWASENGTSFARMFEED